MGYLQTTYPIVGRAAVTLFTIISSPPLAAIYRTTCHGRRNNLDSSMEFRRNFFKRSGKREAAKSVLEKVEDKSILGYRDIFFIFMDLSDSVQQKHFLPAIIAG